MKPVMCSSPVTVVHLPIPCNNDLLTPRMTFISRACTQCDMFPKCLLVGRRRDSRASRDAQPHGDAAELRQR